MDLISQNKGAQQQKKKINMTLCIHQMWLSVENPTQTSVPAQYCQLQQTWMDSIQKQNTNKVCYKFWNLSMIRQLMQQHPHLHAFQDFFEHTIQEHIERCDFARYMVMSVEEGLYVDLDFRLIDLQPLIEHHAHHTKHLTLFLDQYDFATSSTVTEGLLRPNNHTVWNAILWSKENKHFWKLLLLHIRRNYRPHQFVFSNTGPIAVTRTLQKHTLQMDNHRNNVVLLGNDFQNKKSDQTNAVFQEESKPIENLDRSSNWVKSPSHVAKIIGWMIGNFWDVTLLSIILGLMLLSLIIIIAYRKLSSSSELLVDGFQNPNLGFLGLSGTRT
jgi:mannosyltransferase OCH1-like enzyme